MKSTIKIDYDRNYELKPVIKIILPLDLKEGEKCIEAHEIDPRDKLVADFLHTQRNTVENYLFEVNQRLLINNGSALLTTIAAIPEESIFTRLKIAIEGRLIGDDVDQIAEFVKFRMSSEVNKKNTASSDRPVPANYEKWLKIIEFFEWASQEKYSQDIE